MNNEDLMNIALMMDAWIKFSDLRELGRISKAMGKKDKAGGSMSRVQEIMSRYPGIAYRAHIFQGGWVIHLMIDGSEIAIK